MPPSVLSSSSTAESPNTHTPTKVGFTHAPTAPHSPFSNWSAQHVASMFIQTLKSRHNITNPEIRLAMKFVNQIRLGSSTAALQLVAHSKLIDTIEKHAAGTITEYTQQAKEAAAAAKRYDITAKAAKLRAWADAMATCADKRLEDRAFNAKVKRVLVKQVMAEGLEMQHDSAGALNSSSAAEKTARLLFVTKNPFLAKLARQIARGNSTAACEVVANNKVELEHAKRVAAAAAKVQEARQKWQAMAKAAAQKAALLKEAKQHAAALAKEAAAKLKEADIAAQRAEAVSDHLQHLSKT